MTEARVYASKRSSIANGLVEVLKQIDGTDEFLSDLEGRVSAGLRFWDSIEEFPAVYITAGSEARVYQGGGYKDRYISLLIRIYVREEYPQEALSRIIEDIETVIEENSNFEYYDKRGSKQKVIQSTILSIDTDEGLLDPIGAGEVLVEVHY